MTAYSTDYTQLRDQYEAQQQELAVAQGGLESLKRDLEMVRTERDNAQQQIQRSAAAQRQAEAVRLHNFIGALPPLLSIAARLRGLPFTPPAFANAVRNAVPASFELPAPGSRQFLVLVPVILAAAVLTSPQVPDLEEFANVLRRAMTTPSPVPAPETPVRVPRLSFTIPDPIPKPRAATTLQAQGAAPEPPSPTASPTDAALASLLEWIPDIPKGCEDEVAHAFHLQLFRQYGASVDTLPQSPIRDQWTWVRIHAPSLPGIADALHTFLASPPPPLSSGSRTVRPPPQPKPQPPTRQRAQPRRRGIHPKKWTRRPSPRRCG